jgi:DTW domain-containing protein YfiP
MSESPPAQRPKRGFRTPRCSACRLPEPLCACHLLPRLAVRARVVLFLHRREVISSTNTGRLAAQMLEGAEMRELGRDPAEGVGAALPAGRRLVLFPREGARELTAEDGAGEGGEPVVLLVPDGTWGAARRMMHRVPELAGAEVVTLPAAAGPSRYRLRSSEREGALCTLEAVARALGILEGEAVEGALMGALEAFVERGMLARAGRFPH